MIACSKIASMLFLFLKCIFLIVCFGSCCSRAFLSITNETDEDICVFYKNKLPFDKNKGILICPHDEKEFSMDDVKVCSRKDYIEIIDVSKFCDDGNIIHSGIYRFNFDCVGGDDIYYIYIKMRDGRMYYDYKSDNV